MHLRNYQQKAIDEIYRHWRAGKRNVCLNAPTGAGKTVMGYELMRRNEGRSWFVVHLNTLTMQTMERMREYGLTCGLVQGANTNGTGLDSLVCSVQTLDRRDYAGITKFAGCSKQCRINCDGRDCNAIYSEEFDLSHANLPDLLIRDEAHVAYKYARRLDRAVIANGGRVVGLTATPYAEFMRRQHDALVNTASTRSLIDEGALVPPRIRLARTKMYSDDLTTGKVKPRGAGESADWTAAQVEVALRGDVLGDVANEYVRECQRHFGVPHVKTLVAAPTIKVAEMLRQAFVAATGARWEVTSERDGKRGRPTTAEILARYDSGVTRGLISVYKTAIGFDRDDVLCVVLARPYATLTPLAQMVGRGLRVSNGKRDCLVQDYGGSFVRLSKEWRTHFDIGPTEFVRPRYAEPGDAPTKTCGICEAVVAIGYAECPCCGAEMPRAEGEMPREAAAIEMVDYDAQADYYGILWRSEFIEQHLRDRDRAYVA